MQEGLAHSQTFFHAQENMHTWVCIHQKNL